MRVIETKVFTFDELSDKAKERAREWYRDGNAADSFWSEAVIEDAARIADILGISLAQKPIKRANDGKIVGSVPVIYWSGFWSQGDGACFEGSYSFKADAAKAIRDYAPTDKTLHQIADALAGLPRGEGWSAAIKHSGGYYHAHSMDICAEWSGPYDGDNGEEATELPDAEFSAGGQIITDAMRAFANWIYRTLEKEYEYQNADEQVDESILANGYEFTEEGKRA